MCITRNLINHIDYLTENGGNNVKIIVGLTSSYISIVFHVHVTIKLDKMKEVKHESLIEIICM